MNGQGESIVASLCPVPNQKNLLAISPVEVVALAMMMMATAVHVWSIRTLGRHFTFEVTILPNHRVVSSGPYTYVRHPGYTCTNSIILGTLLVVSLNPTGYLKSCGVTETSSILKWLDHLWDVWLVYVCKKLVERGWVEGANLKKTLGKEWEEYRVRVPKRFIPDII
ncbi:hypothetical protein M422DRAFT_171132 [Sphaerobolus stellatus SS14]|uniref:Protein-S-isoprenylcysteine O-methyltransferase n=1 Tax=Sphaerobolus stellatus (strain SS14) TaxID=990650 RepID=A0A0C9VL06_SPHS4|nr:hypothetical protein M422DRAFT_171132 [Sphaerobolus stellatus SS14]